MTTSFDVTLMNADANLRSRVLHLEGDPYQQGKTHGYLAKELMALNLEVVRRRVVGRLKSDVGAILQQNLAFVERQQPHLLQELQGLADGSGIPFQDVLLMNLPIYFVLGWLRQECSQFVKVLRRPDGTVRTLAGKTRDMAEGPYEHVVLVRKFPDGLEMVEVGLAGIVTFPGSIVTNRNIAVTTSGVWSPRTPFDPAALDKGEILPNSHSLARAISSLDDVESVLAKVPRLTGINYIVAQPGRAASFAVTRDRVVRSEESDSDLVRTNHYCCSGVEHLSPTITENASSYSRERRITELLEGVESTGAAWDLFADHESYPQNSVCRHKEPAKGGSETIYASLFVIEDRKVLVGLGTPCQSLSAAQADIS